MNLSRRALVPATLRVQRDRTLSSPVLQVILRGRRPEHITHTAESPVFSNIPVVSPRGFQNWLNELAKHDIGSGFRVDVASQLRVHAGTSIGGVILSAGRQVIPYVDWIQDGMSMSSRLILHTESEKTAELIRPRYSTDIRIATHVQDLSSFLSDIEEHRFNLIVMDADDVGGDGIAEIRERVGEQGLLVGIGSAGSLASLIQDLEGTHFHCALGKTAHCAAFARKGLQHRVSRRGGRRGRASADTATGRSR